MSEFLLHVLDNRDIHSQEDAAAFLSNQSKEHASPPNDTLARFVQDVLLTFPDLSQQDDVDATTTTTSGMRGRPKPKREGRCSRW
jgi:hypothetical protein